MESSVADEFKNLFCNASEPLISNMIEWADIYGLDYTNDVNEMRIQSKRIELKWNVCDFTLNEPKEIEF